MDGRCGLVDGLSAPAEPGLQGHDACGDYGIIRFNFVNRPGGSATTDSRNFGVSEQADQIFLKRFSLIITGLVIFAVLIVFVAIEMNEELAVSENPTREVSKLDRIKPVFDVYAGDTGRAAAQAAAEEAAASGGGQQVAFDGSTDGEMIYNNVCQACHVAGAAGAPQLVADQWEDRLDKGTDTLVSHAINGFNAMPAKGGRSDLSDEQIRATVEYMVEQVQ